MSNISVRKANEHDDFFKIASCIYLTDPFIYPAAFGNDIGKATQAIVRLMGIDNGLFRIDNIAVALYDNEICGILLYNKGSAKWDSDRAVKLLSDIIPDTENFRCVCEKYFAIEAKTQQAGHIELIACCTLPDFRGMGAGKKLIEWMTTEYNDYFINLDVLADNPAAISLYKKYGFEITESYKGFSLIESARPDCLHMVRKPI